MRSMEFDAETLAPRIVSDGDAGRSNALEIAARLGLPEQILARARGQFSRQDDVKVEDLIKDLETATKAAEEERREAAKLRAEAERLRRKLATLRANWQRTRRELEEQARLEAREIVRSAEREAEEIIALLRRRQDEIGVEQARAGRARLARRLKELDVAVQEDAVAPEPPQRIDKVPVRPLQVGRYGAVKTIDQPGFCKAVPTPKGSGRSSSAACASSSPSTSSLCWPTTRLAPRYSRLPDAGRKKTRAGFNGGEAGANFTGSAFAGG